VRSSGESAEIHDPSVPRRAPILGDDHKTVGIGMQRLADQLVRHVRAVVIAGVDVVDATRDRLPQHGQCRVMILGRAKYPRPRELHGTIAEPLHSAVAKGKRAGLSKGGGHDRPSPKRCQLLPIRRHLQHTRRAQEFFYADDQRLQLLMCIRDGADENLLQPIAFEDNRRIAADAHGSNPILS
jgi:hypothetical protein